MCKRLMLLVTILLVLGMAGSANAAWVVRFQDLANTHLWHDANNWELGVLPTNADTILSCGDGADMTGKYGLVQKALVGDPNTIIASEPNLNGRLAIRNTDDAMWKINTTGSARWGNFVHLGHLNSGAKILMEAGTIETGQFRLGVFNGVSPIFEQTGGSWHAKGNFTMNVSACLNGRAYLKGGSFKVDGAIQPSVMNGSYIEMDANGTLILANLGRTAEAEGLINDQYIRSPYGARSDWSVVETTGPNETTITVDPNYNKAYNPSPVLSGLFRLSRYDTTFSWTGGDKVGDANGHIVYFSTDKALVDDGDASVKSGPLDTNSFTSASSLDFDTRYYLRVDEANESTGGYWPGATWSWPTYEFVLIDDIEGYTDAVQPYNNPKPTDLTYVWKDWPAGHDPAPSGTNGSVVTTAIVPVREEWHRNILGYRS